MLREVENEKVVRRAIEENILRIKEESSKKEIAANMQL